MALVWMGNSAPVHTHEGELKPLEFEGDEVVTESWQPPSYSIDESVHNLAHPAEGQWNAHSYARRPNWVASDDPELERALAEAFGCPAGRPQ